MVHSGWSSGGGNYLIAADIVDTVTVTGGRCGRGRIRNVSLLSRLVGDIILLLRVIPDSGRKPQRYGEARSRRLERGFPLPFLAVHGSETGSCKFHQSTIKIPF